MLWGLACRFQSLAWGYFLPFQFPSLFLGRLISLFDWPETSSIYNGWAAAILAFLFFVSSGSLCMLAWFRLAGDWFVMFLFSSRFRFHCSRWVDRIGERNFYWVHYFFFISVSFLHEIPLCVSVVVCVCVWMSMCENPPPPMSERVMSAHAAETLRPNICSLLFLDYKYLRRTSQFSVPSRLHIMRYKYSPSLPHHMQ